MSDQWQMQNVVEIFFVQILDIIVKTFDTTVYIKLRKIIDITSHGAFIAAQMVSAMQQMIVGDRLQTRSKIALKESCWDKVTLKVVQQIPAENSFPFLFGPHHRTEVNLLSFGYYFQKKIFCHPYLELKMSSHDHQQKASSRIQNAFHF